MAEYIERQTALNLIEKEKLEATELCVPAECKKDFAAGLYRAEKIIKQAPTADVVEVVRCSECKFTDDSSNYGLVCTCEQGGMQGTIVSERDFCSCGKRKKNDKE